MPEGCHSCSWLLPSLATIWAACTSPTHRQSMMAQLQHGTCTAPVNHNSPKTQDSATMVNWASPPPPNAGPLSCNHTQVPDLQAAKPIHHGGMATSPLNMMLPTGLAWCLTKVWTTCVQASMSHQPPQPPHSLQSSTPSSKTSAHSQTPYANMSSHLTHLEKAGLELHHIVALGHEVSA